MDDRATYTIITGEAFRVMRDLPIDLSFDALITDPPYSSGGLYRGDRITPPEKKYEKSNTKKVRRAGFVGDARDQRSYLAWLTLILSESARLLKPRGYALVFSDWRQLPTVTDALQCAGFVWRGIITWDKGESARPPHTGYFRHQCEYVVWGTKGPSARADGRGPWPGCFRIPVLQRDKHHLTGKPARLMRELVKVVPEGGAILDPFAGSGTTILAAIQMGRSGIGIEIDPVMASSARTRIEKWIHETPLLHPLDSKSPTDGTDPQI